MRVKFPAAALALLVPAFWLSNAAAAAVLKIVPSWLGTPHDMVFHIATRGQEIWAAGSFGIIVKKSAQAQWKTASDTGGMAMLGIAFAPDGDGVAVGQQGALYEVSGHYDTWTRHDVGTTERLFAVAASPKGEFIAVGSFGAILDRPAGSKDWHQINAPWSGAATPHLYGVLFVNDTTAMAVGENETVVTIKGGAATDVRDLSQLGGEHAKATPTPSAASEAASAIGASETGPVSPALFAVTNCAGAVEAVGQQGVFAVKQGDGDWKMTTVPGKPDLFGATCTSDGRLVGTSSGFLMVGSRQGEQWSWQPLEIPGIRLDWIASATQVDADALLLAGPAAVWQGEIK
ncbi:MAG TPA: hypothetical protein VFB33_16160 [Candidatus Binataceae bacterium]|jgi:hypothetical protein|nr:hypothetical protein [Candidatus Binataceae bacterium]